MTPDRTESDQLARDEARLAEISRTLADAIDGVVGDWVRRCVGARCAAAGVGLDASLVEATDQAAERCRSQVRSALVDLFAVDLDAQAGTPLQVLRSAAAFPTAVLAAAGVAPVDRDEFDRRAFPDDVYSLVPAGFADVDPSLAEPGLVWGAAKAHVHLARRRARGLT